MTYDYEYERMAADADDLYDLYTESLADEDGDYEHSVPDYDHYYFNLAQEIEDEDI